MTNDTVTITAGGYSKAGWTTVNLTRGIEVVPSVLELSVTEEYPNHTDIIPFAPGMPCVVKFGADTVLTGYVDRYYASYSGSDHSIYISCRSKMQDCVDASAEFDQGSSQVNWSNLTDLATRLVAKPYGMKVIDKAKVKDTIPAFSLQLGESSFDIISRVAHTFSVLVYDNEDGDLVLANVGQEGTMSSGFREAQGIQACTFNMGSDQRFSDYIVVHQAVDTVRNLGATNNAFGHAQDQDVKRNRKLFIVSEVPGTGVTAEKWGDQVAKWEKNRRWGRGHAVELVCDSWRASDGRLWYPNTFATVHSPSVHVIEQTWIIASVKYSLDDKNGTTASITLMPQEAFSIQPQVLYRIPPNLAPSPTTGAATPLLGTPPT